MITICFIYFRSLTLANLEAALFSLKRQDFSLVKRIEIVDNNSDDLPSVIEGMIEGYCFPVPARLRSYKHGHPERTHAWSTNTAVRHADTPWVFFTRADYLLHPSTLATLSQQMSVADFITANGSHLGVDIAECERLQWRERGVETLGGTTYDYTCIDTGVWLGRRQLFDQVGGLDEKLTAWGHAQTHYQWKLYQAGAVFARVPQVLFYHPAHGGEKDIAVANQQVADQGLDLREMWARYQGPRVY